MIIVDASVALKWVVREIDSDAARRLPSRDQLCAPQLLLIECADALWSKVRSKSLKRDEAIQALAQISRAPMRFLPDRDLIATAQAIAFDVDRTVYDSLYLAAAMVEGGVLVTADTRFAASVEKHAAYARFVERLGA